MQSQLDEQNQNRSRSAQIMRDLSSVFPDSSGLYLSLEDIAAGVAEFYEQVSVNGILPREYYGLLLSRALWAVGEKEAAECVLKQRCGADAAVICTPFSQSYNRSRLWPISYSGIARRGELVSEGGENGWIIDFSKMEFNAEDALEITLFVILQRLLLELAHVWDEKSGSGWLAIKGLGQLEKSILGTAKRKNYRKLRRDLVQQCMQCLEYCRRNRGWDSMPVVKELIA